MISDTIAKLEARLADTGTLNETSRRELLDLLATLKGEVNDLARTHAEHAQSIAGFTEASAHEATRQQKNPELLRLSLAGLETSVDGFEQSHPRLVEIVNRICTTLSNLGI
jgi:phage shock protein A